MRISLSAPLLLAASAYATIYYAGVAESGGEFGVYSSNATNGAGLPGAFGVDYAFLNQSTVDIWINQNKINLFRVAFLLERMCPLEYGLGRRFNETYFGYFNDAVTAITSKGGYCILDPHNYMRYNDPSQQPATGSVIGNTTDPAAASTLQFQHFWNELAGRYKHNKKNDQAAVNGIRNSGAKQLIIAPGNGYTGGHAWLGSSQGDEPSGDYLYKLHDPINNTAMDIHEYLDTDFSGGHSICNQSFATNMANLTSWLKTYQLKAMVTEFGGDNNTMCDQYITDAINYMAENPEYIGWTAWAAGPVWNSQSPCCTDGRALGSLEPGSLASDGSPGLYYTVWLKVIEPLVPKKLQRRGISSINGPAGFGKPGSYSNGAGGYLD